MSGAYPRHPAQTEVPLQIQLLAAAGFGAAVLTVPLTVPGYRVVLAGQA